MDTEKNAFKPQTSTVNQYVAVVICSILAVLYGHSVGWSSTAIPQLKEGGKNMPSGIEGIDSSVSDWIGGAFCIGALASSPVFGLLADARGRKFAAYVVAICFVIHWILIGFGGNMTFVLIGRAIGGIGGAGSITIGSIYSNEVAEDRNKGILGSFMALFYVSGIFFSFVMGAYVSFFNCIYTYLAVSIVFLPLWWMMPETPVYLLLKGRDERALKALMWLRKSSSRVASENLSDLKIQQAGAAKTASVCEFLRNVSARRALVLTAVLVATQSFCGIFAIHSYASTIFKSAGGALDPFTSTIIYGAFMCIGAMLPPLFVDRAGRKVLLGWSCIFLGIGLTVLGTYFAMQHTKFAEEHSSIMDMVPVITLSGSVLGYYIGLGSVIYITTAEIFTDEMRGVGGSFLSMAIWLSSFILLQFFAPAVEAFGESAVFYAFAVVCLFGCIFTFMFIPETQGKTPQDIATKLAGKSLIRA